MKKQLYRIVTGILAVAWMCLIFSFSSQPATESSKVSGGLCHRLVERANDTLHLDMTEKQQLAMAEKIEYPVRKAAHMTEYAILGLLSFAFYRGILKKKSDSFLRRCSRRQFMRLQMSFISILYREGRQR